jgi:demethylmenaquinone methyltransferase / 2-methoxy-6-polyprenyl-1,4-benzoquinol methylase
MPAAPLDPAGLAGDAKRSYVRAMFTAIAPRYDLLNHLLSLNIDRGWRRRAVARVRWARAPGGTYLDACAGTLDLAAELAAQPAFTGRVVGADFVVPMLKLGRGKERDVRPVGADTLRLPFADGAFDGGTVGFGIRNLVDVDAGFRELRRVLKPGARLVVLDFTLPSASPVRALYLFYFRHVLPLIGRTVSKHTDAYSYLPDSVLQFPTPEALAERMAVAGFVDVEYERLTLGVTALHWGTAS